MLVRYRIAILWFVAVVVFGLACGGGSEPSLIASGGRIAYSVVMEDSYGDLYVMNADGSGQMPLTDSPGFDSAPSWSPDGSRIVFERISFDPPDFAHIYVMNADGSGVTPLTDKQTSGEGVDVNPQWSPDGTKIAFISLRDGQQDVYVMNADGSGQTRLTTDGTMSQTELAWLPDGRLSYAARSSTPMATNGIFVMNADGSGKGRFMELRIEDSGLTISSIASPVWSPDGTRVAFQASDVTVDGSAQTDIFVMNADGSALTRLTNHPEADTIPMWSPDGSWIAFNSQRDGNSEIYAIDVNGGELTRLTNSSTYEVQPAWSPPLP